MCFNSLTKLVALLIILIFYHIGYAKNIEQVPKINNTSIKIAIVAPLTGSYAKYGQELLLATNHAINDLSKQQNYLEIIPFDDQCNPDLAKSIAIQITNDPKIKAVIGHVCSETTIAASKIYAKHGILQIVPSSTSRRITESHINTLFRVCGKDDIQAQFISNFLSRKFNNQKIAILHSQDLSSKELAEYVQEYLAMLKISPTVYQSITIGDLNNHKKIKSILKKLKKIKVDVIFFAGLYKETANFVKTMHYNKITIPIIVPDSTATIGFIDTLVSPEIAAGTIMSFQKLDMARSNILNQKITGQGLFGYAAIQIIYAAIQNNLTANNDTHNLNGRALANWLHNHKVTTILGEKSWDTNGDITDSEFTMYLWDEKGEYWNYSVPIN